MAKVNITDHLLPLDIRDDMELSLVLLRKPQLRKRLLSMIDEIQRQRSQVVDESESE